MEHHFKLRAAPRASSSKSLTSCAPRTSYRAPYASATICLTRSFVAPGGSGFRHTICSFMMSPFELIRLDLAQYGLHLPGESAFTALGVIRCHARTFLRRQIGSTHPENSATRSRTEISAPCPSQPPLQSLQNGHRMGSFLLLIELRMRLA